MGLQHRGPKIFRTLYRGYAALEHVALPDARQSALVAADPNIFQKVSGPRGSETFLRMKDS